ncbi:nitronate monooxygenase [Catenulispora sp. NF23]|uniref:Nitronate monooxygenase n=1 Tax=Catenulispora pinistramenti TaxID=2705254 RepID=A0ABS5KYV1_9ACTN|nr:nitronate monooxygenase [Catenulispora pinistramenti]MBS2534739.1 nitronate monooxygenase [Catenulispora pinistramenti]MBS2551248.1 nitronate monooxygenase [Catenulispora pinistramenti]
MLEQRIRTRWTDLVGVRHPIVQTGMGWVAGPHLVTATARAGALGILASATMSYDELAAAIREVKERTDAPFGVNLRADAADAAERVDLLIKEGVRVASFALAPRQELIAKLKDAGTVVVPSIGAKRHAEKVAAWGVDAVIVQGGEGGGHTGGVATSLLLPQITAAVDIPVLAAGGFFDGRGLAAALAFGAEGVAMGTRFLLTSDSRVPEAVKALYLAKDVNGTVATPKIDGVPHRVLRTGLVERIEGSGRVSSLVRSARNGLAFKKMTGMSLRAMVKDGLAMRRHHGLRLGQVVMAANTPMLLKAGLVQGNPAAGVLSSGQVVGLIDDLPSCEELVDRVIAEAVATMARTSATVVG